MNTKIFRLFIALLISVMLSPSSLQGKELAGAKSTKKSSLGLYISTDVFGYIYPIFVTDVYYSSELSATLDVNNRFLPTLEVGWGHTDMVSDLYEIGYRTRAPYYRVGMDYNMQYEADKPGYIYLGGRIGYTSFEYSVDAPALVDPIWQGEVPVRFVDVPCRAVWAEAVGGVRAEIVKNFYMGWSLRYKYPLYRGPISHGGPWYVPGFGAGTKGILGATYNLSYYFNFTKKKK